MTGGTIGAGVAEEDWRCDGGPVYRLAVSGSSGGREPPGLASVTGVGDRRRRHHEVSIPTAVVRGAGRCFGWQPAAKVSMMIMRPPQQRQGRGSTRGSSAAAVLDVSAGLG